ncbi:MAG: CRISPR system precrRNA processing endoribonuclease RAMP protein Cas6 [candidate division WOR-3 bacterium]
MRYLPLSVQFTATEPLELPEFKGAVVRGGFGLALRRVCCPFPDRNCRGCLLRPRCVWSYVFNTPKPDNFPLTFKPETVPQPFVLEPPDDERTRLPRNSRLRFGLVLIGKAIDFLAYFICALEQLAELGLGRNRASLRFNGVYQNGRQIYKPERQVITGRLAIEEFNFVPTQTPVSKVRIEFLTPTRIIYQGRLCRRPQFHILVRALLRRLWLLSTFHDQPVEFDHRWLLREAEKVRLTEAVFAGADWYHFSRRQGRLIEREGVTGWAVYEGELTPFMPFLTAGEIIHIGKGATFGMGKYRLEVL